MNILRSEQVQRLIAALTQDPYGTFYYLALTTGLRRGELAALRWSDIDLDRGVLSVSRAVRELKTGMTYAEPKTAAAVAL